MSKYFPEKSWDTGFSRFATEHAELFDFATFQQLAYSIHISLRNKIVYFEIPKNASSSIKTLLHQIELGDLTFNFQTQKDLHAREYSSLLTPFQIPSLREFVAREDVLSFAVLRDPLSRLVSGYRDKILKYGFFHAEIRAGTGTSEGGPPSFKEFLYWISRQTISEMDLHWKPQTIQSCLYAFPNIRTFRMTQLDELEDALRRHVGNDAIKIEKVSPHSTGSDQDFLSLYDPAALMLVQRKYKADVELWSALCGGNQVG